jgi:hypothetical protein
MRFLYFYLMSHARARVQAVAPEHAVYWRELGLPDYLGGPFGDRSGGLITFETGSANEAERLVANDPSFGRISWRVVTQHRQPLGSP